MIILLIIYLKIKFALKVKIIKGLLIYYQIIGWMKDMVKKGCILSVFLLFSLIFLGGCQEQKSTNVNASFDNIELISDLVKLAYGNLSIVKDRTVVTRAEVEYLLKNIAGRDVRLKVTVEFYDKENNLLFKSPYKEIDLPVGYEEKLVNTATYDGDFVSEVDHVKIVVEEIT